MLFEVKINYLMKNGKWRQKSEKQQKWIKVNIKP